MDRRHPAPSSTEQTRTTAAQAVGSGSAPPRGLDAKTVYDDLNANILPGVELVPGMVVAIEQAQHAGLTYHRQ